MMNEAAQPLTAKHCVPCEGGMPPLASAVAHKLLTELNIGGAGDRREHPAGEGMRSRPTHIRGHSGSEAGNHTPGVKEDVTLRNHGWQLVDGKVTKQFGFKHFRAAIAFINQIAEIAEAEGHHPDLNLHDYRLVTVSLITHAIHGLSENDFILAAKIQAAFDDFDR